ncbi:MAG: DUF4157 domain-containing protein [Ardenticatenaceae bacterium]|nr:DUF4157 domain-containing protein [Ardenticatenaceae bacterium]
MSDREVPNPHVSGKLRQSADRSAASLSSTGKPLDEETRAFFEPRFGFDFGQIRIHADSRAGQLAKNFQARAFTLGSDVFFGPGEYAPATSSGKQLLAHELTHVTQPGGVIRRQEIPPYYRPETFTTVTTTRLNADGVFTSQVLYQISTAWTEKAFAREAATAQKIVDALEASDSFIKTAAALDDYYAREDTPGIWVGPGHAGTQYVPAGTAYRYQEGGSLNKEEDKDNIFIDFLAPFFGFTNEQQITTFAANIIHEASHAYNMRIAKVTGSGLQGLLKEESRTREAEIKALEEIKANTTDPALIAELDNQLNEIRTGGLTERKVAESVKSGGDLTYLESYYVMQAINRFTDRREEAREAVKKSGHDGFQGLANLKEFDEFNVQVYRYNVVFMILNNKPPIRDSKVAKIEEFLGSKPTLKQLTDANSSGLNEGEKLMFNHVLLLEASVIEKAIQQDWEGFDPDSGNAADMRAHIAAKYLGRPDVYESLPDESPE